MFVGSGVENDLGSVVGKNTLDAASILHVGDKRNYVEVRVYLCQFSMYFINAIFSPP